MDIVSKREGNYSKARGNTYRRRGQDNEHAGGCLTTLLGRRLVVFAFHGAVAQPLFLLCFDAGENGEESEETDVSHVHVDLFLRGFDVICDDVGFGWLLLLYLSWPSTRAIHAEIR
jgi:hypothetical protein